jgi:uroporphyrinogen-III synthase
MRVLVTRPLAQARPWVAALQAQGIDAVALPLIGIAPLADTAPLAAAWSGLARQALVFFVSANAVDHFFALQPAGAVWPADTLAAAPGPGTAAALRAHGVPQASIVAPGPQAPSFDSEAVWAQLQARDWRGRSALIVRGEQGRDWLAEQLKAAGAQTRFLAAYRRQPPALDAGGQQLLDAARQDPAGHLWLFSSSEALRHLAALWPGGAPAGARALASHARIAAAARDAGFVQVRDVAPSVDAVLAAIRAQPEA